MRVPYYDPMKDYPTTVTAEKISHFSILVYSRIRPKFDITTTQHSFILNKYLNLISSLKL